MSDEVDNNQDRVEIGLADAIRHARMGGPVAVATGRCLYCEEPLAGAMRWCGIQCRDLYCKLKGIK